MSKHNPGKRKALPELFLFLTIAVVIVLYVRYVRVKTENEQRENKLQIARSIAATLPKEDLNALEVIATHSSNHNTRSSKNI